MNNDLSSKSKSVRFTHDFPMIFPRIPSHVPKDDQASLALRLLHDGRE